MKSWQTMLIASAAIWMVACGGGSASSSGETPADGLPPVDGEAITTDSGLQIILIEEGPGTQPQPGQAVSVHYTGYLADGTVFDSSYSRGEPIEFPLGAGAVIRGWDEGIGLMTVGSKARLVIPPELGYGSRSVGGGLIPANSTLIFDVELVEAR